MSRMSIVERVAVTSRGFRVLKEYCPGLVQGKAGYEAIHTLQPFVTVWFSARIIDELTAGGRMQRAALCVAALLLFNLACSIGKSMIRRVCDEKENWMWGWFGKVFSDKQMGLDFADLEDAAIQRQKQEVEENLYMFGNGLAQVVWGTSTLVRAGVNLLASVLMTVTLFLSRSGNRLLDHPLCAVALLACIALGGLSNARATRKEDEIFVKWCEGTVWYNRVFMFFGRTLYFDPDRAKDVRIYEQNVLAGRALDGLSQQDRQQEGMIFRMAAYPAAATLIIGLANAVCYLYVAAKAFFGAFGVGSIVQYVTVLSRLGEGLQDLMFILSDNEVYCNYLKKMFAWMDIPNRMYQGSLTLPKRDDNQYEVEFRDVSFRYPNTQAWALRHVNLRFKVGERLAIVGENGSGKTTLIKLLCRLYDPTEGEILLNGVDIRKYDYDEYMAAFSVVFQDFKLFSMTLGQNVAASSTYAEEKVRESLAKAGFETRLESLPKGVETVLYKDYDKTGVEVSGGEAQKIALARALYKNAPFIILDEPTSALDPISEYEVYSGFNSIAGDKTTIYISHRLASCRFCDKIAVFDRGSIIQTGGHEQLLRQEEGKYASLWNAQAQYYVR